AVAALCTSIGMVLFAAPVAAQTAPAQDTAATPIGDAPNAAQQGDIVVTGSRIQRPDLQSNSPISTISSESLQTSNAVTAESY
ncbi:hypothetical protein, partial [Clostridium perfringens]